MKIPRFQHSGVPGAEQQSVGAIVSAGRSKMHGPVSALNKVVQDFGTQVLKAEQEAEYHRLSRNLETDTQALWDGLEGRDHFDENGAPTYDVLAPEFEKGYEALRKNYQGQSKFRANGQALTQSFDNLGDKYGAHARSVVRGRQVDYLKGEVVKQLDGLDADVAEGMSKGNIIMSQAVADGIWTPAQYEKERLSFEAKHHDNRIKSEFQAARETGAGAEYAESVVYPNNFSQADQDKYDNYMRTVLNNDQIAIDRQGRVDAAAQKAEQKSLVTEAKRYQDQIESGTILAEGFVESYVGLVNKIADPVDKADFERSLRWYADGQAQLHAETGHSLDDLINNRDILTGTSVTTIDESERREAVLKTLNAAITQIEKDPQQAAINMGLLSPQQATISDAIQSNDITAWLEENSTRKQLVDEYWGVDAPLINDDDLNTLSAHLDSPNGIKSLASVVEVMGPATESFLSKMFDSGYQGLAMVGDLMRQADAKPAISLALQGREMAESEGGLGVYAADKDSAMVQIDDYIGVGTGNDSLIGDDWRYRQALTNTVAQVYAAKSARVGDTSGIFDEDRYKEAMGSVIGHVYERGDYKIIPPRRNMSADDVEVWLHSMPNTSFDGMDDDLDKFAVWEDLVKGDIDLVWAGEQGHYMLARNGLYIKDVNGEDFVLEYQE